MKHIVSFSGGVGSWACGKRVAERHGTKDLIVLFEDTLMEDEDLYRFSEQAVKSIGGEYVRLCEGRDPWQVFKDRRFLGNQRVDLCSRILKRELYRSWLEKNFKPDDCVTYIGFDWTEPHRAKDALDHWAPWKVEFPMMDEPLMDKKAQLAWCRREGIEPPRLYAMGFPHNNCGGFCVKAGQGSFALLHFRFPERYAYHEQKEQELREFLGKDVSILRHRGGEKKGEPMTLKEFRETKIASGQYDKFDLGACSCFAPPKGVEQEPEPAVSCSPT